MKNVKIFPAQDYVLYIDKSRIISEDDSSYKVSNNVPENMEDMVCGNEPSQYYSFIYSGEEGYQYGSSDYIECWYKYSGSEQDSEEISEDYLYYESSYGSIRVVPQDCIINEEEVSKGIYIEKDRYSWIEEESVFLVISFYTDTKLSVDKIETEAHKIDPKYLPEISDNSETWYMTLLNDCISTFNDRNNNSISDNKVEEIYNKVYDNEYVDLKIILNIGSTITVNDDDSRTFNFENCVLHCNMYDSNTSLVRFSGQCYLTTNNNGGGMAFIDVFMNNYNYSSCNSGYRVTYVEIKPDQLV